MKTSRCIGASLLLMLAVLVMNASAQRSVGTAVIGAGGGSSGGNSIGLQVTLGQPAIGSTGMAGAIFQQGFWYGRAVASTAWADFSEAPVAGAAGLAAAVVPNPLPGNGMVLADIPAGGRVTAMLHDMRGTPVRTLFDGICGPGRLNIPLDGMELPSGTYTIVLTSGALRTTAVFHLIR